MAGPSLQPVPRLRASWPWLPEPAVMRRSPTAKSERARENSAYVRRLLRQRQPEFAATLESAEQKFSCPAGLANDGIRIMIAHRIYHFDGTACHDPGSCWGRSHTNVPPRCAAEPVTDMADGMVTCDLPKGHPGPHFHVETRVEFSAR